jgi:hypothetical protein
MIESHPLERIIATPSVRTLVLPGRYRIYPFDDPDAGLMDAMDALAAAGKRVVLVYPVPEPGVDVPTVLAEGVLQGRIRKASVSRSNNSWMTLGGSRPPWMASARKHRSSVCIRTGFCAGTTPVPSTATGRCSTTTTII